MRPVIPVFCALSLFSCADSPRTARTDRPAADSPYLQAAYLAAGWLAQAKVETPRGSAWPVDAILGGDPDVSLREGVSGVVAFYLEAYAATDSLQFLAEAVRGADYIVASLDDVLASAAYHPGASLYGPIAGAGLTLGLAYETTGDQRYRDGARRCVEWIAGRVNGSDVDGLTLYNDVLYGHAGTGLFLLHANETADHDDALEAAIRIGDLLVSRAFSEGGGLNWRFREDRDFILPNFSHGAAGVGYFLAALHRATGEPRFLDAAIGAATYLESIADTTGGVFRVPYGWPQPEWDGQFDIGWAHGPAGTARLFYRLWEATNDERWLERVHGSARAILRSGVPGVPESGFGEGPFMPDLRFGVASAALFLFDLHTRFPERDYGTDAFALADYVLTLATEDSTGLLWELPRYDFFDHGGEQAAFTGYFYGNAGYGILLLRAHAATTGVQTKIALADDPFAVEG